MLRCYLSPTLLAGFALTHITARLAGWLTKVRRGLPSSSDRLIRSWGQPLSTEGRQGEHASSLSYAGVRLQPTSPLGGAAASQDPGLEDRRPHSVGNHQAHGFGHPRCTAEPCRRSASCVGLRAGSSRTGSTCTRSRAPCGSQPSPQGDALAGHWPSRPHAGGIPTVWCAGRASPVAAPGRWCGTSLHLPAAVWPLTVPKRGWTGWLRCCLVGVLSSGRRSGVSPTRIAGTIARGWGGPGACASTGGCGGIAMGREAAQCSACLGLPGRHASGPGSTERRRAMVLAIAP